MAYLLARFQSACRTELHQNFTFTARADHILGLLAYPDQVYFIGKIAGLCHPLVHGVLIYLRHNLRC